jgi:hypothetical protein
MPIVRSTGCNVLPVVFNTVRENKVLVVGLCCSVCRVVIGVDCHQVYWIEVLCIILTGVGGPVDARRWCGAGLSML